ncbi:hypothetical protein LTS18_014534, partial [Coniosporium uncinatum]
TSAASTPTDVADERASNPYGREDFPRDREGSTRVRQLSPTNKAVSRPSNVQNDRRGSDVVSLAVKGPVPTRPKLIRSASEVSPVPAASGAITSRYNIYEDPRRTNGVAPPLHPVKEQSVEQISALLNSYTTSMLSLATATGEREKAECSYTEKKKLLDKTATQFGGYTSLRDHRQKETKVLESQLKDADEKLSLVKQVHEALTATFAAVIAAPKTPPPAPPAAANDDDTQLKVQLESCQKEVAALQTHVTQIQQDQVSLISEHDTKINGIKSRLSEAEHVLPKAVELRKWNAYRNDIDKLEDKRQDMKSDLRHALDVTDDMNKRLEAFEKDVAKLKAQ